MQHRYRCTLADGTELYYSYEALVGLASPRIAHIFRGPVFTDRKYSVTTSRHVRHFLSEHGGEIVPAAAFDLLRQEAGV